MRSSNVCRRTTRTTGSGAQRTRSHLCPCLAPRSARTPRRITHARAPDAPGWSRCRRASSHAGTEPTIVSSLERILPFLRPIQDLLIDPDITEVMVNAGGRRSLGVGPLRHRRLPARFSLEYPVDHGRVPVAAAALLGKAAASRQNRLISG